MTVLIHFLGFLVSVTPASADLGELVFQDDFERAESQEERDEPGNGWATNSAKRAQGDKQVDLKDGTMRIYISPRADHAVSVTHPFEFKNGSVALRFLLEDKKDSLGLNFADLNFKGVHAGHLFVVRIYSNRVEITDLKTGVMRKDIRETSKAKKALSEEQKHALKGKSKRFEKVTATGKWHNLLVTVSEDQLSLELDGEQVGSFSSSGIAHPTKQMLRLSVPQNVVVDDVRLWKK
tara:strand:- start:535 stop:1242 length:708 start_codon:yes stop_codon:yes gene_type:complete